MNELSTFDSISLKYQKDYVNGEVGMVEKYCEQFCEQDGHNETAYYEPQSGILQDSCQDAEQVAVEEGQQERKERVSPCSDKITNHSDNPAHQYGEEHQRSTIF